MALTVRPAKLNELPELTGLCARAKAALGHSPEALERFRFDLTFRKDALLTTRVAVAEGSASRKIGVAQIGIDKTEAELMKLYVDPRFFGRGVGRALMDWAAREARALGAVRLELDADPASAVFFRRMGAVEIAREPVRIRCELALDR